MTNDPSAPAGVTQLLLAWRSGSSEALDQLTPLVYAELRRLAHHYMRGEGGGHVLQTTALVHEAYLRLVGLDASWQGRTHFFAVAARLMRRILVDFARERRAEKRGGGALVVPLHEVEIGNQPDADLIALDDALRALTAFDERKSRVVELRFFGGLTIGETAEVLGISHATVERDLKLARAWLANAMTGVEGG